VNCRTLSKEKDEERQGRSFFSHSPEMYPRPGYPPPPYPGGPPMMGPPPPQMNPYYQEGYAEGSIFSGIKSFFLGILTQWFLSSAMEQVGQFLSSFLFNDGEIFGYSFNDLLGVFDYIDLKQNNNGRPGMYGSMGPPPPPPPPDGMLDYGGMGMPPSLGDESGGFFGRLGPMRPHPPPPTGGFGF